MVVVQFTKLGKARFRLREAGWGLAGEKVSATDIRVKLCQKIL